MSQPPSANFDEEMCSRINLGKLAGDNFDLPENPFFAMIGLESYMAQSMIGLESYMVQSMISLESHTFKIDKYTFQIDKLQYISSSWTIFDQD